MEATGLKMVPVSQIVVGERHRKDMGDLHALADSIQQFGLFHPVGITSDNRLVFGERRLRAVRDILKQLGLDSIDALELSVVLSREYGVSIKSDDEKNREVFSSLRTLAAFVEAHRTT